MFFQKTCLAFICALCMQFAYGQQAEKRKLTIRRTSSPIKIDGEISEPDWKTAPVADKFIALRPTPFQPERDENRTEVYFLYNDEGIFIGGYLHEKNKDSISHELRGRDGFGANDFIGVIFDTYYDKINGFEYFVTPLGEQMDARQAPNPNGDSEDFSWNSVWESGCKIQDDGWSFEMFIPYSAIRFGKNKIQDWGLNIVRRRQKSGEQLFWQAIDPTVNGFLTQEGMLLGLENIKPPLRLQFSPYFSTYQNHDDLAGDGKEKNSTTFNGGMDIKYGLSPAFTLDMTLIPDFGQVQTDNLVLNLSPFEQKFNDNRPFFTEGAELFNKGNLFYSRRIGRVGFKPLHYWDVGEEGSLYNDSLETVVKNPGQVKLLNAMKISGRTQKGLGIGFLNAITKTQHAVVKNNSTGTEREVETDPLTNYNVLVLNQSLKNNSSVSLVNTSVLRSGKDYDANVTSALLDLYDKRNMWNVGGNVSMSYLAGKDGKNTAGYAHSIYFGKVSGKFNFNIAQDLINDKYDKSDLGYFTNNNTMDHAAWLGLNYTKPTSWYNNFHLNFNFFYSRLVSELDVLKRPGMMYQSASWNINGNGQLKNLWYAGINFNGGLHKNDFYEARSSNNDSVFRNKPWTSYNIWWETNYAKKIGWGGQLSYGNGTYFGRTLIGILLYGKVRFSSKFSVDHQLSEESTTNQAGYAGTENGRIYFSRRNVIYVENILNFKYNFTNRMGLSLRTRHYWSKVEPKEYYELNIDGGLDKPTVAFSGNAKKNYNFLSMDMVYTWQFAQGSFINIVWKNIEENFYDSFEKGYFQNFGKTFKGDGFNNLTQFNSLSLKVIYFFDYVTERNKWRNKQRIGS